MEPITITLLVALGAATANRLVKAVSNAGKIECMECGHYNKFTNRWCVECGAGITIDNNSAIKSEVEAFELSERNRKIKAAENRSKKEEKSRKQRIYNEMKRLEKIRFCMACDMEFSDDQKFCGGCGSRTRGLDKSDINAKLDLFMKNNQ